MHFTTKFFPFLLLSKKKTCCDEKPFFLFKTTQEQRQSTHKQELLIPPLNNNDVTHYTWGRYRDIEFEDNVTFIYEQIVYSMKNLFLLPTGKAGKLFINELAKLFNAWIQ